MNNLWRPTLTNERGFGYLWLTQQPSKMPGHGYALPAQRCRLGSLLQLIPKSVCHYCYALRGRYAEQPTYHSEVRHWAIAADAFERRHAPEILTARELEGSSGLT